MIIGELTAKLGLDSSEFEKGVNTAHGSLNKLGNLFKTGLIVGGVAALGKAIWDCGKAAGDEQKEIVAYQNVLKNLGMDVEKSTNKIESQLLAFQKSTTFSDSQMRPVLTRLIATYQDEDKALTILKKSMDLAVTGNMDLETASKALTKAYDGEFGSLNRLIPGFEVVKKQIPGTKKEVVDLEATLKNLNTITQGASETVGNTFSGKLTQLKNSFSDLEENIGSLFLPVLEKLVNALSNVISWFSNLINNIKTGATPFFSWFHNFWTQLSNAAGEFGKAIKSIWDNALAPFISWLGRIMGPVITAVIDGAAKSLLSFASIVSNITSAISKVLKGDFKGAWEELKSIPSDVEGVISSYKSLGSTMTATSGDAANLGATTNDLSSSFTEVSDSSLISAQSIQAAGDSIKETGEKTKETQEKMNEWKAQLEEISLSAFELERKRIYQVYEERLKYINDNIKDEDQRAEAIKIVNEILSKQLIDLDKRIAEERIANRKKELDILYETQDEIYALTHSRFETERREIMYTYKTRKEKIENEITDENLKQQALAELDEWYKLKMNESYEEEKKIKEEQEKEELEREKRIKDEILKDEKELQDDINSVTLDSYDYKILKVNEYYDNLKEKYKDDAEMLELIETAKSLKIAEIERDREEAKAKEEDRRKAEIKRKSDEELSDAEKLNNDIKEIVMDRYDFEIEQIRKTSNELKDKYKDNVEMLTLITEWENTKIMEVENKRVEAMENDAEKLNNDIKEIVMDRYDFEIEQIRKTSNELKDKYKDNVEMLTLITEWENTKIMEVENKRVEAMEKQLKELEKISEKQKETIDETQDYEIDAVEEKSKKILEIEKKEKEEISKLEKKALEDSIKLYKQKIDEYKKQQEESLKSSVDAYNKQMSALEAQAKAEMQAKEIPESQLYEYMNYLTGGKYSTEEQYVQINKMPMPEELGSGFKNLYDQYVGYYKSFGISDENIPYYLNQAIQQSQNMYNTQTAAGSIYGASQIASHIADLQSLQSYQQNYLYTQQNPVYVPVSQLSNYPQGSTINVNIGSYSSQLPPEQ
ncbi:MAG TPA: hypothetical protein PLW61_02315, partial [Caldisericia bacterium]|nr:hypothetical protein [Caldisericia bacterium]